MRSMTTRLSIFCDKLMEAGWLAALVVAPLFFNVYSSRVFEPDKISLVRSLALLMAGAWVIKQLEASWRTTAQAREAPAPRVPFADRLRDLVRENPLAVPIAAIVVSYLVATLFSVVPAVSWWGSYQRLQGTYSTFSYITIFLIAAGTLRTRAQLDRALNTILTVSFPVALYGLLQHFKLDPLPWGGDTTERVAANMGNSIFVAAYLILVVPLTLARWIETLARLTRGTPTRVLTIGIIAVAGGALILVWVFDFALGVALAFAYWALTLALLRLTNGSFRDALLTVTYTILLAAQFVAIFFTQSRGPWLGLAGGLFAFIVLFALARGARQVMLGALGVAGLLVVFLALFNLPGSPLEPLKRVPYLGRLGNILETETGTGRVRELIWQGALQLIAPHEPLWSPTTGDDPYNALRPLIGYGPEGMYVAYNRYYPPELGTLEARNAAPDRSHNETFDSLVMTGVLGFGAYILLFISVFYFCLKWLGFIQTPGERNAFIALWLAGGLAATLVFGLWRGWYFIGVALPFGMITGLMVFLALASLRRYRQTAPAVPLEPARALWLSALTAALIGHFIEINFGIAIVSTRTYFWFYLALLAGIGMQRIRETETPAVVAPTPVEPEPTPRLAPNRRKQRRLAQQQQAVRASRAKDADVSPVPVIAWTAIVTLISVTLAYEFFTNQGGAVNALDIVQRALFFKGAEPSSGVLLLFGLTWLIGGIIGLGEEYSTRATRQVLAYEIALFAILSFTATLWFALFQTRALTQAGEMTEALVNLLGFYYAALFLFVAVVAFGLWLDVLPRPAWWLRAPANLIAAPTLLFLVPALIYATNFAGVAADTFYKAGLNYESAGLWERSIEMYQRALTLQPTQDFYALFLGRANLEGGRSQADATKRTALITASEKVLQSARRLNPLNTDHSANLARLNRIVAVITTDAKERADRLRQSADYYRDATRLSPNTAYLYNEWSQTASQAGDWAQARQLLNHSLQLDPKFAQTYLLLGETYRAQGDLTNAVDYYLRVLALDPNALNEADGTPQAGVMSVLAQPAHLPRALETFAKLTQQYPNLASIRLTLAELYKYAGKNDLARQELEKAVGLAPNDYLVHLALVNFLSETGQIDAAVNAMRRLIDLLSAQRTADLQRFQDFYTQLQNLQKQIEVVRKTPNDLNARRLLAQHWKARGQAQFALPEYQAIVQLAPSDYDAQKNSALLALQLNRPLEAETALVAAAPLAPASDKALWQNLQIALNAQKAAQWTPAIQATQAALALAADADKPAVQAYLTLLQEKQNAK